MIQNVSNKPVAELFSSENQVSYYIPKYQREYIWSKFNWESLFDDIDESVGGHFLGSIICINNLEVLPTFSYDCLYNPTYLKLFFKYINENTKIDIDDKIINGSFHRWSGDAIEMNRGELLVYSA